jgi:hypothetical protein
MTAPAITDFDGRPVLVGSRVRYWEPLEDGSIALGTVTRIEDWDGDADDEGRPVAIPPTVYVAWDSGETESYRTCDWSMGSPWHDPEGGKVEEIDVLPEGESVTTTNERLVAEMRGEGRDECFIAEAEAMLIDAMDEMGCS